MDSPVGFVVFIASMFICLSSSPTSFGNATTSSLVTTVCKQTQKKFNRDYNQCLEALWKDGPIQSASNLKDLDIATLKLALENAQQSKTLFENMLKTTSNNVKAANTIKECAYLYRTAELAGYPFTMVGITRWGDMTGSIQILDQTKGDLLHCEKELSSNGV